MQTGTAKTILVCEDDDNLRQLIRVVLGDGYRVVEARDGDEALRLALELRPDLVILDVMLPGRSGLDVLAVLRGELRNEHTPVIVMSAWAHAADEALDAGADHFVPKPFEPAALNAIVRQALDGS